MDEILKSDAFKIFYAIAVVFIIIFASVKLFKQHIDEGHYKLVACCIAASVFIYLFYLTRG